MEQYIHTLIAVDSEFAPDSAQVATFFEGLISKHKFDPISDKQRSLSGLFVAKPSGRLRWMSDPMTGEKKSFIHYERLTAEGLDAVPALIEASEHYTVMQSGQWARKYSPILLHKADGTAFDEDYVCAVRCELRPHAVSTSAWDLEAGPNSREVPQFDSTCTNEIGIGVFPDPWTGAVIEVAGAGCARFWIEFEFGRFIYPKTDDNLDVLRPELVLWAERCFRTVFAQGCRFW